MGLRSVRPIANWQAEIDMGSFYSIWDRQVGNQLDYRATRLPLILDSSVVCRSISPAIRALGDRDLTAIGRNSLSDQISISAV